MTAVGVAAQVTGGLVLVAVAAHSIWRTLVDWNQRPQVRPGGDAPPAPAVAAGGEQTGRSASTAEGFSSLPPSAPPAASPRRVLGSKWDGIDCPPSPVPDPDTAAAVERLLGGHR